MTLPVPVYAYHIYDSVTDAYLMTLPLSGVSFSNAINGGGTFSATLSVSDPVFQSGEINWQDATMPYMNRSIWIERNGAIVWGGFLIGRSYDSTSQTVSLTGATFDSYAAFRPQRVPINFTSLTDILTVARTIWSNQDTNAHEPSWVYDSNLSGNKIKFTMQWWSEISQYMENLVSLTPGIEYYIDTYYDPASPNFPVVKKKFFVASPTLPTTDVGLTVSLNPTGGNLLSYTLAEDGTQFMTKMFALGSGADSAQVYGQYFSNTLLDQGYMDVAQTMSQTDQTSKTALTAVAKQAVLKATSKLLTFSVNVKPDESFDLGNVKLGRITSIEITDPRFPSGYKSQQFRITSYAVTPGDNGEEAVAATLEQIYGG